MTEEEKQQLKNEIERIKAKIDDFLRLSPLLGITEKEKMMVVDQFLDQINFRKKTLEKNK